MCLEGGGWLPDERAVHSLDILEHVVDLIDESDTLRKRLTSTEHSSVVLHDPVNRIEEK